VFSSIIFRFFISLIAQKLEPEKFTPIRTLIFPFYEGIEILLVGEKAQRDILSKS